MSCSHLSPYWSPRIVLSPTDELRARLAWQYGAERAARISAGQDAATEADKAAWRALGRRG